MIDHVPPGHGELPVGAIVERGVALPQIPPPVAPTTSCPRYVHPETEECKP